jgi:hypothetical protein
MLFLALALAALVVFKALHARLRPLKICRRCAGLGCKRCNGSGRRFRRGARQRRSTEMRNL